MGLGFAVYLKIYGSSSSSSSIVYIIGSDNYNSFGILIWSSKLSNISEVVLPSSPKISSSFSKLFALSCWIIILSYNPLIFNRPTSFKTDIFSSLTDRKVEGSLF